MDTETRIGSYNLVHELGTGGMGTVYCARDARTNALVALKVLHPQLAKDPDYVRRFEQEASLAAKLDHPNIVRIIESGHDQDARYVAMELVEGETLFDRVSRQGALPPAEVRRLAVAVASALDEAHRARIVHRDIKPGNILLGNDGSIKVSDFGVARAMDGSGQTRTGTFLGSVAYAAPEAVDGRADARSDLYSLGVVLYQALVNKVPFEASTPLAVLRMHERNAPPELNRIGALDPALRAIVGRLLQKDPDDRYQSASELLRWLARGHVAATNGSMRVRVAGRYLVGGAAALVVTAGLILTGVVLRPSSGGGAGDKVAVSRAQETAAAASEITTTAADATRASASLAATATRDALPTPIYAFVTLTPIRASSTPARAIPTFAPTTPVPTVDMRWLDDLGLIYQEYGESAARLDSAIEDGGPLTVASAEVAIWKSLSDRISQLTVPPCGRAMLAATEAAFMDVATSGSWFLLSQENPTEQLAFDRAMSFRASAEEKFATVPAHTC